MTETYDEMRRFYRCEQRYFKHLFESSNDHDQEAHPRGPAARRR